MSMTMEGTLPDNLQPEQPNELDVYLGPDGKFTPEHVSKLFFDSFRFSQGSPGLQSQIFSYLSINYGDYLSPEVIESGVEVATPKILQYVASNKHPEAEQDRLNGAIKDQKVSWLYKTSNPNVKYDSGRILTSIMSRDAYFNEKGGRVRNNTEAQQTSRSDSPHLNQFVFYGLMGRDTGSPEYNAMFSELVDKLLDVPDSVPKAFSTESTTPVSYILARHFSEYPGDLAEITPHGLAVLQERFHPIELEYIGLPMDTKAED